MFRRATADNSKGALSSSSLFALQPLEARLLLTTTPASVLTNPIRQDLLNHWNGSNKATLQNLLNQNKVSVFDSTLLSYMTARSGPNFYFDPANAATNASYIQANFNTATTIANANAILSHHFPEQSSSAISCATPRPRRWRTIARSASTRAC